MPVHQKKYSMHKNDLIALAAIVITLVNAVVVLIRLRRIKKNSKTKKGDDPRRIIPKP